MATSRAVSEALSAAPPTPRPVAPSSTPQWLRTGVGRAAQILGPTALTYGVNSYLYDDHSDALGATALPLAGHLAGRLTRAGMRAFPGDQLQRFTTAQDRLRHMSDATDSMLAHEATGATPVAKGFEISPSLQARQVPQNPAQLRDAGLSADPKLRQQHSNTLAKHRAVKAELDAAKRQLELYGHPMTLSNQDRRSYDQLARRVQQLTATEASQRALLKGIENQARDLATRRYREEITQRQADRAALDAEAEALFTQRATAQGPGGANIDAAMRDMNDAARQMRGRQRAEAYTRIAPWAMSAAGIAAPSGALGEGVQEGVRALGESIENGATKVVGAGVNRLDDSAGLSPENMQRLGAIVAGVGATAVLGFLVYKLMQNNDSKEKKKQPRRGRPAGTGRPRGRPRKHVAA